MMMERGRLCLLAFWMLLCLLPSRAEAEIRIGVVDLQRAMEQSEEGKRAKAAFQKKVEQIQKGLKAKQDELAAIKQELETQGPLLSSEAREEKQSSYQNGLKDFKRQYEDAQEELRKEDAKLSEKIIRELQQIIEQYGKKEGFDVILERTQSAVLYQAPKIDITDEIIRLYDESKRAR